MIMLPKKRGEEKLESLNEEDIRLEDAEEIWEVWDEEPEKMECRIRISANRARIYSDLPECIKLLSKLEKKLQGKKGLFGEWLQTAYCLNDDFYDAPSDFVKTICKAFKNVKKTYGIDIAQTLYNTQAVVLPSELLTAACYLQLGGKAEDLKDLGEVGLFMEVGDAFVNEDELRSVVEYMDSGGSADSVFKFLENLKEKNSMEIL